MTAKAEDLRIGLELDMHMDETSRAGRAGRRHPRKRTRRRRDENAVAESPPRAAPAGPAKRQSNVTNQTREPNGNESTVPCACRERVRVTARSCLACRAPGWRRPRRPAAGRHAHR
jgi:hypothetical protein